MIVAEVRIAEIVQRFTDVFFRSSLEQVVHVVTKKNAKFSKMFPDR